MNCLLTLDMNRVWKHLGCFKDSIPRAMTVIEGSHALISGDYTLRADSILKCFYVSKWRNFRVNNLNTCTLILCYLVYTCSLVEKPFNDSQLPR